MTKKQWLEGDDPYLLLDHLVNLSTPSERKLRLFACACVRRVWTLLTDERSRAAVASSEMFADQKIGSENLMRDCERAEVASRQAAHVNSFTSIAVADAAYSAWRASHLELTREDRDHIEMVMETAEKVASLEATDADEARERERTCQAELLRDVFSPFHTPVINDFCLAWNSATVLHLAQAIYDERAFDRLPILADALEDAGCTNQDILTHCRGGGEHVRGCWVVDLLLGKD